MDGSLVVSRDYPGRGAWLCRDPQTGKPQAGCFEAARARKGFDRAYRTDVSMEAARSLEATIWERAIMDSNPEHKSTEKTH